MENSSLYAFVKSGIKDYNQTKITYFDRKITAKELIRDIDKTASYLVKAGIKYNDVVSICLPNIPQAVVALYAVNKIGAIANVLHPYLTGNALLNALKTTNSKLLFIFSQNLEKNQDTLLENNIHLINCRASEYFVGLKKLYSFKEYKAKNINNIVSYKNILGEITDCEVKTDGKNDAVLLHSSGTFGKSKIVRLSSFAVNSMVVNIIKMVEERYVVDSDASMLAILPIFHGFGLGVCVHLAMYRCRNILVPKFSAQNIAKISKKTNINMIAAVPSIYKKLLSEPKMDSKALKHLQLLFCGGDKLFQTDKEQFDKLLKRNGSNAVLMEGYGLSEACSVVTINIEGKNNNSQGIPLPNTYLKVVDENNKALPYNTVGEICVCSPSVMNGYLDDTAAEYVEIEGKSYIKTGDYGHIDEENYLYFKDRKKRVIMIGGINIYPMEIENLINALEEVSCCAVARRFETKPHTKVYLEMNSGYSFDKTLQDKISSLISDKIIKYAVPTEFEVVDKIKLNKIGKVDFYHYENLESK